MVSGVAYLNFIGTAVPDQDLHAGYIDFARSCLGEGGVRRSFERLVSRSAIDHRYGVIPADYYAGTMPDSATRMRDYEIHAPDLAARALEALGAERVRGTTHLIVASCTGFYAPGIDLGIVERFGLDPGIERTIVGFMGCYAALSALKLARHIVRSEPAARVLVVNIELCSLHLQPPLDIEAAMGFSIFGDGCAAAIVSADATGMALDAFASTLIPGTTDDITWRIGNLGFEMRLSLDVPRRIASGIARDARTVLAGTTAAGIDVWAVHPGGRAVLDAVQQSLGLAPDALDVSRDVLRAFGNMSSATIVFVLERILARPPHGSQQSGCALAFGPGMICETMRFSVLP
jgi:alpha-pyrone synthase